MSQYDGWLHSGLPSPYDGQLHDAGPLDTGGPVTPGPITSAEAVGQPTVMMVLTQPAPPPPKSPPAWSSIGKPTPRRPRRREIERRLVTTTTRLRVASQTRVRAHATHTHSIAVMISRSQVASRVSVAELVSTSAILRLQSRVSSDVVLLTRDGDATAVRHDSPVMEELLLLGVL